MKEIKTYVSFFIAGFVLGCIFMLGLPSVHEQSQSIEESSLMGFTGSPVYTITSDGDTVLVGAVKEISTTEEVWAPRIEIVPVDKLMESSEPLIIINSDGSIRHLQNIGSSTDPNATDF